MSTPKPESTSQATGALPEPPTGWRSPLLPLFLTVLVDVLALTIVLPLLPFLAERYGASPMVATSLFACFSICQFISGPILGRASDRVGRKPTLLVSQLGTFAGLLMIAFTSRLEFLFIGRMIDGLTAGNLTIAQAYIVDLTLPEKRTRAFGLIGIAFGIGFLIGPAASGYMGKHLGYHAPFMFAAALSLTSVVLTATLLPALPPKGTKGAQETRLHAFTRFMSNKDTRGRLIELFFFTWSFSTLTSGLALFLAARMGYDVEKVGYVFAFSGIVGGSTQGLIGRLAKKLGEKKLSLFGIGCMVTGYAVLGQARILSMLLIAVAIGSIGSSFTRPTLTTMLTETVNDTEHGTALGTSQALASIAQTIGPLLGGYLIERELFDYWAFLAGGLSAAIFLVRLLIPSETTRRGASTGPAADPS